jgi:hypothetical protein
MPSAILDMQSIAGRSRMRFKRKGSARWSFYVVDFCIWQQELRRCLSRRA